MCPVGRTQRLDPRNATRELRRETPGTPVAPRHAMKTSMFPRFIVAAAVLAILPGCSGTEQQNSELRAALDRSSVTLRESVTIAESSLPDSTAIRATLLTVSDVLAVGTYAGGALKDIRIDPVSGEVLSTTPLAGSAPSCPGSVSMGEAIAAAEAEVSGDAVMIQPDDDGECNREVKVLDGDDVLYEVKVAPDGAVIESEVADDASETEG